MSKVLKLGGGGTSYSAPFHVINWIFLHTISMARYSIHIGQFPHPYYFYFAWFNSTYIDFYGLLSQKADMFNIAFVNERLVLKIGSFKCLIQKVTWGEKQTVQDR
jgi:hypothetical protein